MTFYKLNIGNKWNIKYTPLNPIEKEYPYCDANGNILKKISGKFEKGYFINEATNEKHEKAYKLVNGKASEGFKGRIKEVGKYIEVDKEEVSDLLIEKEFLGEDNKMYNDLMESGKAIKLGGYFGNGFKVYKVYITPNPLYKGFLDIRCGTTNKSELMRDIIGEMEETNRLSDKLKEVELEISKVNQAKVEDLIDL